MCVCACEGARELASLVVGVADQFAVAGVVLATSHCELQGLVERVVHLCVCVCDKLAALQCIGNGQWPGLDLVCGVFM